MIPTKVGMCKPTLLLLNYFLTCYLVFLNLRRRKLFHKKIAYKVRT